MTHDESYIEILISKHLDGEISTSEQRHLQETLDQDPQTRQLFEELKELHEISQTAVDNTLSQGRPAEDILGAAFNQVHRITWWDRAQHLFFSQFTTGLAAGLLIALSVQMISDHWPSQQPSTPTSGPRRVHALPVSVSEANINHQIDWYHYVDENGQEWLVEGLREGQVLPVTYRQDF